MVTSKKAGQLTLRVKLTEIFNKKLEQAQKKDPSIGFQTFVNDYIERALRREEEVELANEFLEFLNIYDDIIAIRDHDIGKTFGLQIRDKKLWCENCKKTDCIHVGFAFGIQKVANVLVEHGFKPPKKIDR